jgi:hypothetical protein
MTSPIGFGLFVAMRHFKHKFAVVQHLFVKIPKIITIGGIKDCQKLTNSLNLNDLFKFRNLNSIS